MGTAYMQMISKPNSRHHSTYHSSYGSTSHSNNSPIQTAETYNIFRLQDGPDCPKTYTREQEMPLLQSDLMDLSQSCCNIIMKDMPFNTDVRAIMTFQGMINCMINNGEMPYSATFYRDEKFKKPCIHILAQGSGSVKLMAYSNRRIDLQEIFRDATVKSQADKDFLSRIKRYTLGY